ncbi:MAG: IS30 family transposase [Lachnospiraceae bacterium]|nr:IS30 family transposase [Lachnospiraceae bacterium]
MGKHITEIERYKIETMLKDGIKPCDIAVRLGKHFTTIYKEIEKGTVELLNSDLTYRKEYCADAAQRITNERKANKGRDLKVGNDYAFVKRVEYLIGELHYSPYAAVQDIRKNKPCKTDVCKTTLYSYIDKGIFLNISNKNLYSKSKQKNEYDKVERPSLKKLKSKTIEDRPKDIYNRDEYGHWEMDTVYSGKNKSKSCLLVLTERCTRDEYLLLMPDRTLESTIKTINNLEKTLGYEVFSNRFKTITCDNGSEFGDSSGIETSCIYPDKQRTQVYFCHPYSSFERGSNENANKLIRHWIPKGEDISKYDDEYIQFIQDWINNYPRELFSGLSSNEYKASLKIS